MLTAFYVLMAVVVAGASVLASDAIRNLRGQKVLPPAPERDEDLVRAVATALRHGVEINNGWRDYGGHGLVFTNGCFVYGASHDGHIDGSDESHRHFAPDADRRVFDNEDEFCEWLRLKLTEHGPCLRFDTAISRARLELAARHALPHAHDGASIRV
jgi:hypothetical protein